MQFLEIRVSSENDPFRAFIFSMFNLDRKLIVFPFMVLNFVPIQKSDTEQLFIVVIEQHWAPCSAVALIWFSIWFHIVINQCEFISSCSCFMLLRYIQFGFFSIWLNVLGWSSVDIWFLSILSSLEITVMNKVFVFNV